MKSDTTSQRYYLLDGIRGIAAFAVVAYHWPFIWMYRGDVRFEPDLMPLWWLLSPIQHHGSLAVDLFFSLSGFVFSSVYGHAIADGRITAGRYFVARFSRIYPLHLVTLFAVVVLQYFYYRSQQHYYLFSVMTWKHLVLQLGLVNFWFPRTSVFSFNAPMWSISVEAFLYLVFFAVCRWGMRRPSVSVVMCILGLVVHVYYSEFLGRGVLSFFLGSLASDFVCWSHRGRMSLVVLLVGAVTLSFVAPLISGYLLVSLPVVIIRLVIWPAMLVLLAWPRISSRLVITVCEYLGGVSFAVYLWHYPLLLALGLAEVHLGWSVDAYYSLNVISAYLVLLMLISTLSYYLMERPLQTLIRRGYESICRKSAMRGLVFSRI